MDRRSASANPSCPGTDPAAHRRDIPGFGTGDPGSGSSRPSTRGRASEPAGHLPQECLPCIDLCRETVGLRLVDDAREVHRLVPQDVDGEEFRAPVVTLAENRNARARYESTSPRRPAGASATSLCSVPADPGADLGGIRREGIRESARLRGEVRVPVRNCSPRAGIPVKRGQGPRVRRIEVMLRRERSPRRCVEALDRHAASG
jgi:hypothetical protein